MITRKIKETVYTYDDKGDVTDKTVTKTDERDDNDYSWHTKPFMAYPTPDEEDVEIKIKYHNRDLQPVTQIETGDWIDLRAAEDVELEAGDFTVISLGVSMELPEGYEAHIVPRSSTFKKWGILQTNSMGVIDHSYCGDNDVWGMPVYATKDTSIHINDRICQFRIEKSMQNVHFIQVEKLGNDDRGGFGSTGTSDFEGASLPIFPASCDIPGQMTIEEFV